ncbi:uncharacterized protein LOC123531100 [Mercenaria mercenaria]|uniref:uncharacterized protein LOC123531100 n=1 Tax=Mercenaria mercenaria TaxID=6596 RepID=UPI00234F90E7|nr:uncharacterized protein LOC123531100 [Mercenaria mercenaria]
MDKLIMKYLFVGFLNAYILFGTVNAESCKRKSSCSCECSQGIVDLKALGTTNGPRYKDVLALDQMKYSYNPCDPFTETDPGAFADFCYDVAACQIIGDVGTFQFYDTGTQDSVTFYTENANNVGLQLDTDVVIAKYTSGDAVRQTEVILVCNDQDSNTAFDSLGEITNTPPTYRFVLVSPECCFGNGSSGSGLSGGSILLIIAFSILGAYLIVGLIVKKFVYKESGKELIPNTAFWFALPSLIKDGCVCIYKKEGGRDRDTMKYLFAGFLNAYIIFGIVNAESCKRKSSCSCECSQGIVNLKALGTTDGPRYKDVTGLDRLFYSYNPCDPFSQTYPGAVAEFCNMVAACQIIGQSGVVQFYDAGTQDSVTFYTENANNVGLQLDNDVVIAKYTSGDAARQTEVILLCNDLDSTTSFDALGEIPNTPPTIRLLLISPECCFRSAVGSGLSGGSVLLIV